jgi:hypothetical protein
MEKTFSHAGLYLAGVKGFEVTLSEAAEVGLWKLEVEVESDRFTTEVNVSLVRGSFDPAAPELTIAEEHYVELRFARETRRRYKPGLPFVGKVSRKVFTSLNVIRLW